MTPQALDAENQQLKAELTGLRGILGSVGSYVYTKDLQSRYTFVNALTCELFGAPFENIVGHDDSHFFPPEVVAVLQANDRLVLETGATQVHEEPLIFPKTGEKRMYLAVKAPMYDENGVAVGICGVSTDITEQKRVEAQLGASRRLMDTVLDNVEANVYLKDANGRYLYANRTLLSTVQLTLQEMLGRTDADLFPADVAKAFKAVDERVFASGQPQRVEEAWVDNAGNTQYFWSTKLLLQRADDPDCLIGLSTNITPLKHAEVAVERSEARFRALFEASSEAVIVISRTHFIDCNGSALQLMGLRSKAEFLELTLADLSPPRQACGTPSNVRATELVDQALQAGRHRFEWTLQRCDNGKQIPVEAIVTAVELEDGPALLITLRDLTEHKRHEEQIHRLAYYDALTQLPNRRLLYDRLSLALAQHHRGNLHGCIIYLDLDNFKPLNDSHGHNAGDLLLQEVGRRLVSCLRAQDTVARQGGDEFVVLLIGLDPSWDIAVGQANHVAEKILAELARPYVLTVEQREGPATTVEHRCTASLGVAVFRPTEGNVDNILRRADEAMYRAKAKGRNQIQIGTERSLP